MFDKLALTLNIIGGLNWGLIGLFQFDLVAWLFGGSGSGLSRVVYTLVGLSALMTTTLPAMAETVRQLKELPDPPQVMVGGAVVTEEYAKTIGADFYARDVREAVKVTARVFGGQ